MESLETKIKELELQIAYLTSKVSGEDNKAKGLKIEINDVYTKENIENNLFYGIANIMLENTNYKINMSLEEVSVGIKDIIIDEMMGA